MIIVMSKQKKNTETTPFNSSERYNYSYYASARMAPSVSEKAPPKSSKPITKGRVLLIGLALLVVLIGIIFSIVPGAINNSIGSGTAGFSHHPDSKPSIDSNSSIWVIINKQRPYQPINYVPDHLVVPNVPLRLSADSEEMHMRSDAATALEKLVKDAKAAGISIRIESGYRSYAEQQRLYNYYVGVQGKANADEQSARPGFSEHQSGLAVDLGDTSGTCSVQQCFADTPTGQWIKSNSYKYGFLIRYTENGTSKTGYEYEPWHVRYVGTDLAVKVAAKHFVTLEEYFNLTAAPDYK
jgi:D-alanyl-D-alanine carboxypeptidase